MDEHEQLARQFEQNRGHLRAVAYRMLGSLTEAEDAVQEAWLRLSRTDVSDVGNLAGWLTTVVSRVCLDMLRSRKSRREDSLDTYVPDPVIGEPGPEDEAVHADAIGLALLVVLETLSPAERLAFVLHDMFGVGFDEIAAIVDKSPAATRQLASRARRRVQGAPTSDADVSRQRAIVEAFMAASRGGDFEALLELLDRRWCCARTRVARARSSPVRRCPSWSAARVRWSSRRSCSAAWRRTRNSAVSTADPVPSRSSTAG